MTTALKGLRGVLTSCLVLGLLGSGLFLGPTGAAQARRRVEKLRYETPYAWLGPLNRGFGYCRYGIGCVTVIPKEGERFLSVVIKDDKVETMPYAYVNQDTDRDGRDDKGGYICGKTYHPFKVEPDIPVHIFVLTNTSYCPGEETFSGTVTVTLAPHK